MKSWRTTHQEHMNRGVEAMGMLTLALSLCRSDKTHMLRRLPLVWEGLMGSITEARKALEFMSRCYTVTLTSLPWPQSYPSFQSPKGLELVDLGILKPQSN